MEHKPKNLELERLVFFSDAVVAIAITLLALDLKIETEHSGHLTFADILHSWRKFLAFTLSFFYVAVFWKIHHEFYSYIRKIDAKIMIYNIAWLFFVVTLPFTTSLISSDFSDSPAIFMYCMNTLFITLFQNQIWDYVAVRPEFLNERLTGEVNFANRISCNVAMLNALLASVLALFYPVPAFIVLACRYPTIVLSRKFFKYKQPQNSQP